MGDGGTFIENQTIHNQSQTPPQQEPRPKEQPKQETPPEPMLEPPKLPETSSELVAWALTLLPKSFRTPVILVLLGAGVWLAYKYLIPQKPDDKKPETTMVVLANVYVSGKIHINNGEPKPNEIKRITLRDIDANAARVDGIGKFTFERVKIPDNKRVLIDVTFADGKTISTEEIIVGEADTATRTIRLPDLYIERPTPATKTRPAQDWTICVTHNGTGDNIIHLQR